MSSKNKVIKTFISELREQGRITEQFLDGVSDLTIEELIAVKLELSSKMVKGKLYGLPLWGSMPYAVRDGLLMFVTRNCITKTDMASTIGLPYEQFTQIYRKYCSRDKEVILEE